MARVGSRLTERAGGALAVVAASWFFGGVVVLGKVASNQGMPVTSMLALRFGLAAVTLLALQLATRGPLRPARGEGSKLAVLGAVGYAVEATLFFLAIERGTASAVTLLFFTYPVIVTIISALLGRGIPGALVLGSLAAALVGSAVIISSSGGIDISASGVVFAVLAACAYTGYLVGIEGVLHRTASVVGAMWVSASASIALTVVALFSEGRLPSVMREWLPIIGMGAFTAGAFLFLFVGVRRIGAVRTAIIAAMEPFATSVLAIVFLSERLRASTVVGGVLILVGATAAGVARGRVEETVGDEASVP